MPSGLIRILARLAVPIAFTLETTADGGAAVERIRVQPADIGIKSKRWIVSLVLHLVCRLPGNRIPDPAVREVSDSGGVLALNILGA